MSTEIFASLTQAQLQAVNHIDGPLLILAGPGSGKTRVITHRIANLLQQGVDPRSIIALTFTNKSADEMRERLTRLAPREPVWMGTFHRFCARLLRRYASLAGLHDNYSIYDVDDAKAILKQTLAALDSPITQYTPDQIYREISNAKNQLLTPASYGEFAHSAMAAVVKQIYPQYQQALITANACDFDDLLLHVATLLRENEELRRDLDSRYRYILVDEYQDTNLAQYAIVRALSCDYANLAVTGDPDQSIYGWRGANLRNILDFEKDYPNVNVVRLEQNYRSTKRILSVADQLISHNRHRKHKELYTENDEGAQVALVAYATHNDEASQIAVRISEEVLNQRYRFRDFAIFFRTNALTRVFEQSLFACNVPFQVVNGHAFYERKEVKDLLAYLRLVNNPQDTAALLRVINTPVRGIGKKTIERLTEHARRHRISVLDTAADPQLAAIVGKRGASKVRQFLEIYDRLCLHADRPIEELLGHILAETGYRNQFIGSHAELDHERLANVDELLTAVREFDQRHPEDGALAAFLEQTSLVADTDAFESEADAVKLMTLHAAKGLEFPWVFIPAVEQRILPHERSLDDPMQMEEERRLLFVGITRAEQRLQLSYSMYRAFRGGRWPAVPSSFLVELPRAELDITEPVISYRGAPGFSDSPAGDEDWSQQGVEDLPVWEDRSKPADTGSPIEDNSSEDSSIEDSSIEDNSMEDNSSEVDPSSSAASTSKPPRRLPASLPKMMTAAEMLGDGAPKVHTNPDHFRQDMLVNHPDHGPGKIIALSGEGRKRKATVQFFNGEPAATIHLAFSNLSPVKQR